MQAINELEKNVWSKEIGLNLLNVDVNLRPNLLCKTNNPISIKCIEGRAIFGTLCCYKIEAE